MRTLQALDVEASYGANSEGAKACKLIDRNGHSRLERHQWNLGAKAIQVLGDALRPEGGESLTLGQLANAVPYVADEGTQFLDTDFYPTLLEMYDADKLSVNVGRAEFVQAWTEYEFSEKVELFTQIVGANGVALSETPDLIPLVQRLAATAVLCSLDDAVIAEFLDGRGLPTVLRDIERLSAHLDPPHNLLSTIETAKRMALSERATDAAIRRHKDSNVRREWVQSEWLAHRDAYAGNKSAFARDYVRRLRHEFNVTVTEKQLREVWLRPPSSASGQDGLAERAEP